jgi:hypothetical protein
MNFRFLVIYCIVCIFQFNFSRAQDSLQVIHGGNARMLALGGSPLNYYLEDYSNIYINPAYLASYVDLAMIELGSGFGTGSSFLTANQQFGVSFSLGKVAVGLFIGRREGSMFADNSYGYQSGGHFTGCDYMKSALDSYLQNLFLFSSSEPLTPIQILTAFRISDVTIGLALYRSEWSREDDGSGSVSAGRRISASLSQFGIKGGILYPLGTKHTLDIAGCLRWNDASAEYENKNSGAPLTSSSFIADGYEISLSSRLFYSASQNLRIIPKGRFEFFWYEPEVNSIPLSSQLFPRPNYYRKMEYEIGVGIESHWEEGLAFLGLSYQYISLKNDATSIINSVPQITKYSRSWYDLPKISACVEYAITGWLIGRVGYFKRLSKQQTCIEPPLPSPPTETNISLEPGFLPSFGLTAAEQTLSLGFGISFNRFALEGYIADQMLGNGPYVISGIQQSFLGVVSLSYQFSQHLSH